MRQNHTRKVSKHLEDGGHTRGGIEDPRQEKTTSKSNDWIYHTRLLPNIYLRLLYDHPPIVLLHWTVFYKLLVPQRRQCYTTTGMMMMMMTTAMMMI
jgi:hypothetical protein